MNVTPIEAVLRLPESKSPRSEGIHVSSIIRNIAKENGVLKYEVADDLQLVEVSDAQQEWWGKLDPVDRLRICIGLAWEEWYVPQLEGVMLHPGEMQVDGIYMTHDGESVDMLATERASGQFELRLHEVKATYKSTNTVGDLHSQWMWLAQTKAYCKGLNTRTAFLHVLFLCGDYTRPIRPMLKVWRIDYTQAEIDDNWELIVSYMHHHLQQEREDMMKDTI